MADETHGRHTSDDVPAETTRHEPVHEPAHEPVTRSDVLHREREEHGGIKWGSAFFGWLAATGMAVLLSAVVAVSGLLAGDATDTDTPGEVNNALDLQLDTLGWLAIVVALVIWFVSYYSGGYVAGRMARFDGIKQGLAVWLWSIVVTIVVAVIGVVFGTEDYDLSFGIQDLNVDDVDTRLVVVVVFTLLVSLVGAMLGGLAGMRFHRRVDRTGLGH